MIHTYPEMNREIIGLLRLNPENPVDLYAAQRIEELESERLEYRDICAQQAEDEGLWFVAHTASEAYLQQELRKLHSAIEGKHD